MALILVTPFDDVGDLGAEQLLDALDGRQRVLDDVVEQAGGDGDGVELHVGQEVGDGEGVDQVGLAGMAHLSPVLEGREDVGPPAAVRRRLPERRPGLFRGDPRSESWNLVSNQLSDWISFVHDRDRRRRAGKGGGRQLLDLPFLGSLYWPGFGHGNFLARTSNPDGGFLHELTASICAEGTTHAE